MRLLWNHNLLNIDYYPKLMIPKHHNRQSVLNLSKPTIDCKYGGWLIFYIVLAWFMYLLTLRQIDFPYIEGSLINTLFILPMQRNGEVT